MLIDWPEQKRELRELVIWAINRRRLQVAPALVETQHVIVVEGSQVNFVYADGHRTEMKLERHEYSLRFDREEVSTQTAAQFREAVEKLGGDMAEDMEKNLYKTLEKASPRTGGLFGGRTGEEIIEEFIKGLEAMDFGFDDNGRPEVVVTLSPRAWEQVTQVDSPELRRRLDAVVERKRSEWLRRESHRKLVD